MMPNAGSTTGAKSTNGHNAGAQQDRTLSHGEPAQPLLRVLPIKRWIPQDVHSVMDYVGGLTVASGYLMTDCTDEARLASVVLGGKVIAASLLTDYRLSVAKVIPIRAHEALDYVWGASCIAAPFVLGYWKKSPMVAMTHVAVGASTILASLFTDYRSYRQQRAEERAGRGRSQGDLQPVMPT